MSETAIAEIRRCAGKKALEGIDLSEIDAQSLLRQSHVDLAERARPGTPLYPLTFVIAVFAGGVWTDHLELSLLILAILMAVSVWRGWAIGQVLRREASSSLLRWPMIASSATFGVVTGGMVADHGLDEASFLLLLCAGVFSIIGALFTSVDRRTESWFLLGGILPILVGLAWDLDLPRLAVFVFLVFLVGTTRRLAGAFGNEYWRQLLATAIVEAQRQFLEEARERAEEAGHLRDDLLRNFTHELRTPMNGVLGLLSLVQSQEDPEERRQLIELATESANRMLQQVNRILEVDTPRIEQKLRPSVVHPRVFLERWIEHFSAAAHKKKLRLKLRVQEDVPADLFLDRVRLRSIVVNLLDNAIKFTAEGRIDVYVYGVPIDDYTYRLGVAVRDTGPGIPAESREMIFEAFRQLDASVTRSANGLGLGLTIARQQARLMGGDVDVSSEVGDGSTFRAEVEANVPQARCELDFSQASPEKAPLASA